MYDTIVIGDGIAAWTASVVLARRGQSVAVLGRQRSLFPIGEYLPPEGVMAMEALGLGQVLRNPAHRPSRGTLSVWGTDAPVRREVLMQPGGRAFCIDRKVLETDLKQLAATTGVVAIQLASPPDVQKTAGIWQVGLRTERPTLIRAGFLVDATGRSGWLARALNSRVRRLDKLIALALVWTDAPTQDAALCTESLPDGWCYAAPLSADRLATVFLTQASLLPQGAAARRALAQERIFGCLFAGNSLRHARLSGFRTLAAGSQLCAPSCGPGWAAIGDAAMAFDPLASAGMTKVLVDIREALGEGAFDHAALNKRRRDRFAAYRAELRDVYASERRFDGAFWASRHGSYVPASL